jgi:Ala-tRNA(Pro) deacylase
MDDSLHARLLEFLRAEGVPFRLVEHAPTLTSADSARERGEPLGAGAKALLVKGDDIFRLLVLPADQRLDSSLAKENLGVKSLRFATAAELEAIAGVPSGAVPPFGAPLLPVPLFADPEVGRAFPNVAFNAGSRTSSIIMAAADWEQVARPARVALIG